MLPFLSAVVWATFAPVVCEPFHQILTGAYAPKFEPVTRCVLPGTPLPGLIIIVAIGVLVGVLVGIGVLVGVLVLVIVLVLVGMGVMVLVGTGVLVLVGIGVMVL